MRPAIAALAGLLFGIGLLLSGMADPARVLGFLDPAGRWDPSLAWVMAGAVVVATPAFAWTRRRGRTVADAPLQLPAPGRIDPPLLIGSLLFGTGWGLAGLCPGPALLGALLRPATLLFVAAMVAGMGAHALLLRRRR